MKRLIIWLVVACVAGGGAYLGWRWYRGRGAAVVYRTDKVERTDLVSTITAVGTIVPEEVVDVGAQVNGMIASLGTDAEGKQIDYRSTVTEGMILARVDDTIYRADVSAAEAQLAQNKAQVEVSRANLLLAKAKLDQAERDWGRAQKLGPSRALSQADYDAAKSAFEQSRAMVEQATAQVTQAEATVGVSEASLKRASQNLAYCDIGSPVNGVIIDRRVDVGQTVVSSFNAPSLFLIAKDLTRMQVLVQVNEADIEHVHPGDKVTYSVDALPGEVLDGVVRKVRLNATMTQNVVTYTVEIVTENKDLKLLPYLTANVMFVVERRSGVLSVPNTALRWAPEGYTGEEPAGGEAHKGGNGVIWVMRNGQPQPELVRTGMSDGTRTEVSGEGVTTGDAVVVGGVSRSVQNGGSTNPFAPQFRRRGGNGGQRPAGAGGAGGTGGGR
jgi:HlyD family secretion protein